MLETNNWFVVYTRPRWEKKVSALLTEKGIENYCPLTKVTRQWSDRKKTIEEPLFKGYVFVFVSEKMKWSVRDVSGVLNYVHWLGKPAIVQESEIESIRKFLKEFNEVQVESIPEVNSNVVVRQGVMMNYKGVVLEVLNKRVRVLINSLGLMITATFDIVDIEEIKTNSNL